MMRALLSLAFLLASCATAKEVPADSPTSMFRSEFLSRVNQIRESGCKCGNTYMPPAPPLVWNQLLERSALSHARDMSRYRYFSHTSRSGMSIKQRIEQAGYALTGMQSYSYGENIAAGQKSISQVMTSWLKSEGHCKNIMNPRFREIGIGVSNNYWVQDFAARTPRNTSK